MMYFTRPEQTEIFASVTSDLITWIWVALTRTDQVPTELVLLNGPWHGAAALRKAGSKHTWMLSMQETRTPYHVSHLTSVGHSLPVSMFHLKRPPAVPTLGDRCVLTYLQTLRGRGMRGSVLRRPCTATHPGLFALKQDPARAMGHTTSAWRCFDSASSI